MFVISSTSERKLQLMVDQKKKKRYCSYAADSLGVRSGSKDAQRAEKGHPYQSWFSGKALKARDIHIES